MTYEAFSQSMMLLILASFIVERSLAVIYETRFFIERYSGNRMIKPMFAILYAMLFVTVIDINVAEVIKAQQDNPQNTGYVWSRDIKCIFHNLLLIFLSGVFIAGGSKASLKLFRDVWNIKSSDEALRKQSVKAVPADPSAAAGAAAKGNSEAEVLLYNLLDTSGLPKAKK